MPSGSQVDDSNNAVYALSDTREDEYRWEQSLTNLPPILRRSLFLPYVQCVWTSAVCMCACWHSISWKQQWDVNSPNSLFFPFLNSNDSYRKMQSITLARKWLFWDRPLACVKKHFKNVWFLCFVFSRGWKGICDDSYQALEVNAGVLDHISFAVLRNHTLVFNFP